MKRRIREAIVVEGQYDKNALSQVVDAPIITLEGFAAFHNLEKLAYLRRLAERRGLILLMDSDGAGFQIRGWLKGALQGTLPPGQVRQAYVPEIAGKERRKRKRGRAGLLGVEGMSPAVLLESLRRAGATFLDETADEAAEAGVSADRNAADHNEAYHNEADCKADGHYSGTTVRRQASGEPDAAPVTKADLYAWGLSGGPDSARRRYALLSRLSLPRKMNANAMLEALNLLYTRKELEALLGEPAGPADGTHQT